jgi:hypothetical protein
MAKKVVQTITGERTDVDPCNCTGTWQDNKVALFIVAALLFIVLGYIFVQTIIE